MIGANWDSGKIEATSSVGLSNFVYSEEVVQNRLEALQFDLGGSKRQTSRSTMDATKKSSPRKRRIELDWQPHAVDALAIVDISLRKKQSQNATSMSLLRRPARDQKNSL
jgi:hypothetical protein